VFITALLTLHNRFRDLQNVRPHRPIAAEAKFGVRFPVAWYLGKLGRNQQTHYVQSVPPACIDQHARLGKAYSDLTDRCLGAAHRQLPNDMCRCDILPSGW
jgi:hypothetical protein